MALPFGDDAFDVAVMPLVIFFVPEPEQGRRRDGTRGPRWRHRRGLRVGHAGRRLSYAALQAEMRELGVSVPEPPSPDASRMEVMRELWTGAGLEAVETREITAQRTSPTSTTTGALSWRTERPCRGWPRWRPGSRGAFRRGCASGCRRTAAGRITYRARANAVKGRAAF